MRLLIARRRRRWLQRSIAARPPLVAGGDPAASVAGPDPDRVLLLGSGPASGLGAATQDDALTGRLAQALADRTGRGAVVEAQARPDVGVDDVPALLRQAALPRYDGVVLFVGLVDAIAGMPPRRWRARLHAVVDELLAGVCSDAVVMLTTIPPASAFPTYSGRRARVADRRVGRLNDVLVRTAGRPGVALLDLPAPRPTVAPADRYPVWADAIADLLSAPPGVPGSDRDRPTEENGPSRERHR